MSVPRTVLRSALAPLNMTTGGERRHPRVIDGCTVYNWVGFGWIAERKASASDRETLPIVIEPA